jgi:hypothetical protein
MVAMFGRTLMLADKQERPFPHVISGTGKAYNAKDFVVASSKPSIVRKPLVVIKQVVEKCPKRE